MKKDKQWALNELRSKINPATISYSNDAYRVAILVVSQIENPKPEALKPLVVPKELAEWLAEQRLGEEGSLFSIIAELEDMWARNGFDNFISDNKKELIEVVIGTRPYEVEIEQIYVVKVPNVDLNYYYGILKNGDVAIGIVKHENIKDIDFYHFTEKEILAKIPDVPKSMWIKLEDVQ